MFCSGISVVRWAIGVWSRCGDDVTGGGSFTVAVASLGSGDDTELASPGDGFALAIKIHSGGNSVFESVETFRK